MHQNSDLIDLLRALNAEGAEYLIVGGYAFAVHGRIRATKDVDIFVGTDPVNAARVWRALRSFGAPLDELRIEDLTQPETFFIMGRPPNQIDIITTTSTGFRLRRHGREGSLPRMPVFPLTTSLHQ